MKGNIAIEILLVVGIIILMAAISFSLKKRMEETIKVKEENKLHIDEMKKCKAQLFPGEMCVYKFNNEIYEIYITDEVWG